MIRKFLAGSAQILGDREVVVTASTGDTDRMGEIVEQDGIDLAAFRSNPIVLWNHDSEHVVGTAKTINVSAGKLRSTIEFAPEGASQVADTTCNLVKAGIVTGVSIGFDPVETEPMNPALPRGPQRYVGVELLEISFVAIPANTGAAVVQRAYQRVGRVKAAKASIATLHRRWGTMAALGRLPPYHARVAEVRALFGLSGSSRRPQRALSYAERQADVEALAPPLTPDEMHLCDVARDRGEILTRARIDMIVAEARRIGQTPSQRYLQLEAMAHWGRSR